MTQAGAAATDGGPPFQAVQRAFAAHVRNPDRHPAPAGVDPKRMAVYAGLVYRNIEGFLARTFPAALAVLPEAHWHAAVRDFIERHTSDSPYFRDISTEFLRYLETERDAPEDPPFLAELCHYEWARATLIQSDEVPPPARDAPVSLDAAFALSPLAWPLHYRFPVHRIGAGFQPEAAPDAPTWLILCRDRDDRVRRLDSNAATTRLLGLLAEAGSARRALMALADELGRDRRQVLRFGEDTLRRLVSADVVAPIAEPPEAVVVPAAKE
ncbi:MAG: putative DNA-binding domain-containing protein [Gammaproteobacteria bacterium]|nr:putative DNA-binding domain-containing protein [Gammaproteobacteria bacterium]